MCCTRGFCMVFRLWGNLANMPTPPSPTDARAPFFPSQSHPGFGDTPTKINSRLGQNVPVFQIAQEIPLPPYNYVTGAGGAAPENVSFASAALARRCLRLAVVVVRSLTAVRATCVLTLADTHSAAH